MHDRTAQKYINKIRELEKRVDALEKESVRKEEVEDMYKQMIGPFFIKPGTMSKVVKSVKDHLNID